jgi:hypothetical protein
MNKKLNKISRKRHYIGGGDLTDKETKALETIRIIRINGIKEQIKAQNEIINYVGETYSTTYNQSSPPESVSKLLDNERTNAENKLVVLNKQLKDLEGLEG